MTDAASNFDFAASDLLADTFTVGVVKPEKAAIAQEVQPRAGKIMIVDDEDANVALVRRHLKTQGYINCVSTTDPAKAMSMMRAERPDVMLLDVAMPEITGLDILESMKADGTLNGIQVIVLTPSADTDTKLRALELGAADFLCKPIDHSDLIPRVRNSLVVRQYTSHMQHYAEELEAQVARRTAELAASRQEVIHCLARAAEFRDDDMGRHVLRVGRYAGIIGAHLGWKGQQLQMLEQAAQLHDVGKIGIPDAILMKPGKLTPEEYEIIQKHCGFGKQIVDRVPNYESNTLRTHTTLGERILDVAESPILKMARRIALTHHEKWDGTGYPLGLVGEEIPIEGRITAVADVFDALSSRRPYKPAFPLEKCFGILIEGSGSHFDPRCVDAFFAGRDQIMDVRLEHSDV